MKKVYGGLSKPLKMRLGVLAAAKSLAEVPTNPPDRCHQLTGKRAGQLAVTLKDNWRLIFVPDHDPVPKKADGGIDLSAVTMIKLLEVVDYHGK